MAPVKRHLRRTVQVVALVGTLVVGIIALALIVSQTPLFRDWLRKYVVRQAGQYVNGTVSIGSLGGNLFYGVELGDIALDYNGERDHAQTRRDQPARGARLCRASRSPIGLTNRSSPRRDAGRRTRQNGQKQEQEANRGFKLRRLAANTERPCRRRPAAFRLPISLTDRRLERQGGLRYAPCITAWALERFVCGEGAGLDVRSSPGASARVRTT